MEGNVIKSDGQGGTNPAAPPERSEGAPGEAQIAVPGRGAQASPHAHLDMSQRIAHVPGPLAAQSGPGGATVMSAPLAPPPPLLQGSRGPQPQFGRTVTPPGPSVHQPMQPAGATHGASQFQSQTHMGSGLQMRPSLVRSGPSGNALSQAQFNLARAAAQQRPGAARPSPAAMRPMVAQQITPQQRAAQQPPASMSTAAPGTASSAHAIAAAQRNAKDASKARIRRAIGRLLSQNSDAHNLWCVCSHTVKENHKTESIPQLQSLACKAFMTAISAREHVALLHEFQRVYREDATQMPSTSGPPPATPLRPAGPGPAAAVRAVAPAHSFRPGAAVGGATGPMAARAPFTAGGAVRAQPPVVRQAGQMAHMANAQMPSHYTMHAYRPGMMPAQQAHMGGLSGMVHPQYGLPPGYSPPMSREERERQQEEARRQKEEARERKRKEREEQDRLRAEAITEKKRRDAEAKARKAEEARRLKEQKAREREADKRRREEERAQKRAQKELERRTKTGAAGGAAGTARKRSMAGEAGDAADTKRARFGPPGGVKRSRARKYEQTGIYAGVDLDTEYAALDSTLRHAMQHAARPVLDEAALLSDGPLRLRLISVAAAHGVRLVHPDAAKACSLAVELFLLRLVRDMARCASSRAVQSKDVPGMQRDGERYWKQHVANVERQEQDAAEKEARARQLHKDQALIASSQGRRRLADSGSADKQEVNDAKARMVHSATVSSVNVKLSGLLGARAGFGSRSRIFGQKIAQRKDRRPNMRLLNDSSQPGEVRDGAVGDAGPRPVAAKTKRILGINELVIALHRHPNYSRSTELYEILQAATMMQS